MAETYITIRSVPQKCYVDPTEITSIGGTDNPRLQIPLKFDFEPERDNQTILNYNVIAIEGKLNVTGLQPGISNYTKFIYRAVTNKLTCTAMLEFTLNSYQINRIEQIRQENLACSIDIIIHVGYYDEIIVNYDKDNQKTKRFLTDFSYGGGKIDFSIPQSSWTQKLLSGLGYRSFKLIEIPESSNLIPQEYEQSIKELKEADRFFILGEYDKVAAHCRSAIDSIKPKLQELRKEISSESEFDWIKKISNKTTEWLDAIMKETTSLTSKVHHSPSVGHFSRFDAEIIYMVTTAIVAYTGRVMHDKEA